jgi:hypothetical protein
MSPRTPRVPDHLDLLPPEHPARPVPKRRQPPLLHKLSHSLGAETEELPRLRGRTPVRRTRLVPSEREPFDLVTVKGVTGRS